MDSETRERVKSNPTVRVVRWTVPWIVLAGLVYVLWGAYGDYRVMQRSQELQSTEPTVSLGSVGESMTAKAVVLIDGLNLRDAPDTGANILVKIPKSKTVEVYELKDGWYRVKEPGGRMGWVSANAQYVKLTK